MKNKTDFIASKFLGKSVNSENFYNPKLLVAIPRAENRILYNIDGNNLPFDGWDIWHAYEFSAITENGLPVSRVLKIKYSCKSKYIVESKSLKLYLNSFNMSHFGKNTNECLNLCRNLIKKDINEKLETKIDINFLDNDKKRISIFKDYKNLMNYIHEKTIKIDKFKEAPELLKVENTNKICTYKLYYDSLRSNCRVTHQPDFGDIFIYYKSKKHILEDSLLKYICSFRTEYHFHEECTEMIYKRLFDILNQGDKLIVTALYTRRGGIDICPTRSNCTLTDVQKLANTKIFARNSIKQ